MSFINTVLAESTIRQDKTPSYEKEYGTVKENSVEKKKEYKWDIVWFNVGAFVYLYLGTLYGVYLGFTVATWKTWLWMYYVGIIGVLGATAGAHRLWTHKTFKANLPLRILLAYFQSTCFQNSIYVWVRDHRVHHKYTDTDADPHNAARGFFFSHVGWLLVRKHKDVKEKGATIWMEDLKQDAVVMFQHKYYPAIMLTFCFILPTVVPWYFWGESLWVAWFCNIARYMITVNGTWCVNSVAHLYGYRPYDKNIYPRENVFVGYMGMGEGWHNYHHTFPWDYRASEVKSLLGNQTTVFINFFAKIGWAWDLKTVSEEMIKQRIKRTGEESIANKLENDAKGDDVNHVWGWDDDTMTEEDRKITTRYYVKE